MSDESIYHIFNEYRAVEHFKRIRNRLRRYKPQEIVLACIKRLNIEHDTTEKYIQELRFYPPWFLFLLIKWTIKYGEYASPDRKSLTEADFRYLINLIHDFFGVQRGPTDYGGVYLFFRTIAYQQLWVQENYAINKLGRQHKFFSILPPNHYLKSLFKSETNISIDDFIELTFALLTRFITQKELFITESWFGPLENAYPPGTITKFLSIFSKNWSDLKDYLENQPQVSVAYEFHEQTPLRRYPLLKIQDKYFCFSRELISHSAQNIVYDILREKDAAKFMDKFGDIFERYVEDVLSKTKLHYLTEKELKQKLNPKEKVVDFVVVEANANIFIDAKGIELSTIGMVSHISQIVTDKSRNSIIKGVEQYYSTVNQCLATTLFDVSNKRNYLIIITYKDVFLGSGKDFLNDIAIDKYSQIISKYPNCNFLRSDQIYFISIDDFDLLVELIISRNKSISEVLEFAVKSDQINETKKFLFRQHLTEISNDLRNVSYLNEHFVEIANSCENKIRQTSSISEESKEK